jgi:hypothetical protein
MVNLLVREIPLRRSLIGRYRRALATSWLTRRFSGRSEVGVVSFLGAPAEAWDETLGRLGVSTDIPHLQLFAISCFSAELLYFSLHPPIVG